MKRTQSTAMAQIKSILIASALALICSFPADQRTSAQGGPSRPSQAYHIRDIFFVDQSHGWIVANENTGSVLFRTSDGGNTWMPIASRKDLYKVFFLDARTGWALTVDEPRVDSPRTSLYRTDDGGMTWYFRCVVTVSQPNQPNVITGWWFTDSMHGWFVGEGTMGRGLAFSTSDGGQSIYVMRGIAGKQMLTHISGQGPNKLWIFGKQTILASFDAGRTWQAQFDDGHPIQGVGELMPNSGVIASSGKGWAAGSYAIISTNDFGKTWIASFVPEDGWFTDISFWDADHACAVGNSHSLVCTADGGKSWTSRDVLPVKNADGHELFRRILCTGAAHCWVISEEGFLSQSDNGGSTWRNVDLADKQLSATSK